MEKLRSAGARLTGFARGETKPAPEAPRSVKAAYYTARTAGIAAGAAARAARTLAPHIKKHIQDFDHALTAATGITITKPIRERLIPAAKWAAPRVRRGVSWVVHNAREKMLQRWRSLDEKPKFFEKG